MNFKDQLSGIISLIAVSLSLFSLFMSYKTYSKNASVKRLHHALDLNKLLISNPLLLSIYDKHRSIIVPSNSSEIEGLHEVTFDFILLTWENVVNDIADQNDEELMAWKVSMNELFIYSTPFRDHILRIINFRHIFPVKFRKFLEVRLDKTNDRYLTRVAGQAVTDLS